MPGRLVHGLQHVVGEPAQAVVDPLDGVCDLPQDGIGNGDDFELAHDSQI